MASSAPFGDPPRFASLRINIAPTLYRCEPAWNWNPPPLPDHDFWFVVGGRGTLEVGGIPHPVLPGTGFVLCPGDTPRGKQDPSHRLTVFYAHFDVLTADGTVGEPLRLPAPGPFVTRDSAFVTASAHRIEHLWRRGEVGTSNSGSDDNRREARHQAQLLLSLLLWQAWDDARFPAAPGNEPFEMLAAAIRREPGRMWSLDNMASAIPLSRAQFARRFRVLFGVSPTQFVIQTRLERARPLLLETDMTLEQIAHALGYSDVFFFSRQFKQFVGQTPGALRKDRR